MTRHDDSCGFQDIPSMSSKLCVMFSRRQDLTWTYEEFGARVTALAAVRNSVTNWAQWNMSLITANQIKNIFLVNDDWNGNSCSITNQHM